MRNGMYKGYFDGACNPNPGAIGLGACIFDDSGAEIDSACTFREYGTNNESEYMSLILLMNRAIKKDIVDMDCYGDSKLIINQVTGKFKSSDKFKLYLTEINKLKNSFNNITFTWIKREENTRADELSKLGLNRKEEYLKFKASKAESYVQKKPLGFTKDSTKEAPAPIKKEGIAQPLDKPEQQSPVNVNFKVENIGQGRLLIKQGTLSAVVDLISQRCSCNKYRKDKVCNHVTAVKKLMSFVAKKTTVKQTRLSA
jgi:ribonuclease HI